MSFHFSLGRQAATHLWGLIAVTKFQLPGSAFRVLLDAPWGSTPQPEHQPQ